MMSSRSVGSTLSVVTITAAFIAGAAAPAAARDASLSKAHARTVAKAINLRGSDLPGYSAQAYKPSKSDKAIANGYQKCVGTAHQIVSVTSAEFSNSSGYGFSSGTDFVATPAAATHDAALARTAHAQKCLKQSFAKASSSAGLPAPRVTLTKIPETVVSGISALYGYQITVSISIFGRTASLRGYQIDFVRGNAEVELDEIGTASPPQSVTAKPLAALIARAKTQVPATGL